MASEGSRFQTLTCMYKMPSYEKHVSSTSARILTGWGVIRRRMFFIMASDTLGVSTSSGSPSFICSNQSLRIGYQNPCSEHNETNQLTSSMPLSARPALQQGWQQCHAVSKGRVHQARIRSGVSFESEGGRASTSLSKTGWGSWTMALKASKAWPYVRYNGQAMDVYMASRSAPVVSAACLMIECTCREP